MFSMELFFIDVFNYLIAMLLLVPVEGPVDRCSERDRRWQPGRES